MCRMGEVPFDRMRGLNPALFDLPLNEMQEQLLPELDGCGFPIFPIGMYMRDTYLDKSV